MQTSKLREGTVSHVPGTVPVARRVGRFAGVGAVNTAVDFGLFNALVYLAGTDIVAANTVGYCTGILCSFVLNKYWTFADRRHTGRVLVQFPLFVGFSLIGLALSNLTVWSLAHVIAPVLAKACSIGVTFLWNYWASDRFVYRGRPRRT